MQKCTKVGRYAQNKQGKIVKIADIYPFKDHHIDNSKIDPRVFHIANRLKSRDYNSYLVGGAVRDLLLGKQPKDFDVVTDATPSEIRGIIKNSRIIGKRFRLVHIHYRGGQIIEVTTFRALDSGDHNHLYGTIEEDVKRRDFTVNALYYDLNNQQILDFVQAMDDFRKQQMRNIIALPQIFNEDPVRIIRCIKYAAKTGFKIPKKIDKQIQRDSKLLDTCSKSRLAEELSKILCSQACPQIMEGLQEYSILEILLPFLNFKDYPNACKVCFAQDMLAWQNRLQLHHQALEKLDEEKLRLRQSTKQRQHIKHYTSRKNSKANDLECHAKPPAQANSYLGKHLVGIGLSYLLNAHFTYSHQWQQIEAMNDEERSFAVYLHIKACLNELNIPNIEVLTACEHLLQRAGLVFAPRLIVRRYGRIGPYGCDRKSSGRTTAPWQ